MSEADINALVIMLQAHTPLERLSNMEARTVFELMQQRGYIISKPSAQWQGGVPTKVS
jgi:hypothetical protein